MSRTRSAALWTIPSSMNKKTKLTTLTSILALTLLLLFAVTATAAAQEEQPELSIRLNRDWGYGGFHNDIQGKFSIIVTGPENLVQVRFFIDDELIGSTDTAPFEFQFNTGRFDPGIRVIYAVGELADGSELRSADLVREFLSEDEANKKTFDVVLPILVVTGIAILASTIPFLFSRKGKLRPIGEYGPAGGTICPRCQFPFSRSVLSPNIFTGKIERCPHCGKLSIRPRASQADLAAAEERLRAARKESGGEIEVDEQDELRRALDDSKFEE